MDASSTFGNWETLPATVIVNLYEYLTLKEILRLSSVCKKWREVLLQSRPTLWKVLILDLQPEKVKWKKQLEFHRKMCLKFSAFTKNLIVSWCICDTENATYFFTHLPEVTTKFRALNVRRRNSSKRYRQPCCLISDPMPLTFAEALKTCIAQFNCLNCLSFGYSCDDNLLNIFCDQSFENRLALTTLNISCAGNYKMRPVTNISYPSWFLQLHSLTMDWNMITEKFLNSLSTTIRQDDLRMKRLNVVISCKDSITSMASCQTEWTHLFDELKYCNYKLSIGLILIAIEARLPFEQLEHVFHSSAPVEHVLVVYTVTDGNNPVQNYDRMIRDFQNLRTLTVQGIEPDDEFPNDTDQGDAWTRLASDSELSKFSIFGVYLDVDNVLRMLQTKADLEFSFSCSKFDIVKQGVVLDFLIPLTSDRKFWREFEKTMNKSRGSCTAVDKKPLQRILKRKGERVEHIVQYVLSEIDDAF